MTRLLTYLFLFLGLNTLANNVSIQNLATPNTAHFSLELSWENSWKLDTLEPNNHDAVWLFAKYQEEGGEWKHLKLSPNTLDHSSQNSDLEILAQSDSVGVFIRPSVQGAFPFQTSVLEIANVSGIDLQEVNLKVFAIEMVYVPSGAFYLGDSLSNFSFRNGANLGSLFIDSENAIPVGSSVGELCDTCSYSESIPADFPKGVDSFYCMKYEISQAQFVAFLNILSFKQQENLLLIDLAQTQIGSPIFNSFKKYRNGIVVAAKGNGVDIPAKFACDLNNNNDFNSPDDGQNLPCNFLNEEILKAYLDWAGLRPMTELEYEKACRGSQAVVKKEFAWGNGLVSNANNLMQSGTETEYCSDTILPNHGFANHVYAVVSGEYYIEGPIRCGFAANNQSNRLTAGAGYYGAMEMSGNLWEQCVRAYGEGVNFTGKCGDGNLSTDGFSNEVGWSNGNSDLLIFRGGSWLSLIYNNLNYEFRDLAISDRFYGDTKAINRRNTTGGRGVR